MGDWMVYLTNNYGLDYEHEYEILVVWCSGLLSHGVGINYLHSMKMKCKLSKYFFHFTYYKECIVEVVANMFFSSKNVP